MTQKILKLGLIGGGPGSFIGPVHRMAACLEARFALTAGPLSRTLEKSRQQAARWGLPEQRAYDGAHHAAAARPDEVFRSDFSEGGS